MTRTIAFDLDGTLVDTLPDLAASLDRLAAAHGLAAGFSRAEVVAMVGDGTAALVRRAMAARGQAADDAAIAAFVADYTDHVADSSTPFPGAAETLAALHGGGWRIAVCTNKPEAPAKKLLRAVGLDRWIAAIGGGDSFPVRKPDPAHLIATVREAGGEPARAVMVGDHQNDVLAASGAGLACIFAAWGYGLPSMAAGAAAVAERLAQVPGLAERLLPA